MTKKYCTQCEEWIDKEHFYKDAKRPDGLRPWCKKCLYAQHKRYRSENPEKAKAECAAYAKRHPARVNTRNAKWRKNNPEKVVLLNAISGKKWRSNNGYP